MRKIRDFSNRAPCLYACATLRAPLAQLVERFHGKEEVTGPIPVGGSIRAPSLEVRSFQSTPLAG